VGILPGEDDPAVSVFFSRAVRLYRPRIRGNTDGGAKMWRGVLMTPFTSSRNWDRFVRIVGRLTVKLCCCTSSSHCKGSGFSQELSLWNEVFDVGIFRMHSSGLPKVRFSKSNYYFEILYIFTTHIICEKLAPNNDNCWSFLFPQTSDANRQVGIQHGYIQRVFKSTSYRFEQTPMNGNHKLYDRLRNLILFSMVAKLLEK